MTEGVWDTFTARCAVCGGPVHVVQGVAVVHECRIEIPVRASTLESIDSRDEPTPGLRALVERFRDG